MGTSTNVIEVSDQEYVNVSNGNMNCALMIKFNQKLRVHVGGAAPDPDAEEHFVVSGGSDEFSGSRLSMMFQNLEAEDDVWVRSESGFEYVMVVRGNVVITGNR